MQQRKATMTESELIKGCLKGERKAQNALYQRYKGMLFGLCMRYSDSKADAEDILQEGFIKIFKKITQFSNEGSFEGWLKKVMIHTSIEFYRKQLRQIETQPITNEFNIEWQWCKAEETDLETLLQLIQALPAGCRAIFNLYVIEGYSHKEIANILNITEGTSRSQLAFAKKKLAQSINQLNYCPEYVSA